MPKTNMNIDNNITLKILLVIPTYNNANTIVDVASKAVKTGYNVLVINDGSTDKTKTIIEGLPVFKVEHLTNKGKGSAILTAAKWASGNNYTHIITIDADGQHTPSDIPKFITQVKKNPLSIIVGTRNFSSTDVPTKSRFGRKFSNFWLKAACGTTIADTQSGFRAYPVDPLLKLKLNDTGYNFEIEVLAKAVWAGLPLESVDISVHYSAATKQASHFDPLLDNIRISKTYAKLVFRNFIPVPHKILYGKSHKEKLYDFFFKPIKTLKELIKERISAKELALAAMLGVFLGTLPLFAVHSIAILFCATRLKLNRIMAFNMQHFCMPPVVPAICVEVGYFALNGKFLTKFNLHTLGYQFLGRVGDYLLGTIIVAPILAIIAGIFVYTIVNIIYSLRGKNNRFIYKS
jgi:glycosyltransferase involved in cell wall biosynthesis